MSADNKTARRALIVDTSFSFIFYVVKVLLLFFFHGVLRGIEFFAIYFPDDASLLQPTFQLSTSHVLLSRSSIQVSAHLPSALLSPFALSKSVSFSQQSSIIVFKLHCNSSFLQNLPMSSAGALAAEQYEAARLKLLLQRIEIVHRQRRHIQHRLRLKEAELERLMGFPISSKVYLDGCAVPIANNSAVDSADGLSSSQSDALPQPQQRHSLPVVTGSDPQFQPTAPVVGCKRRREICGNPDYTVSG